MSIETGRRGALSNALCAKPAIRRFLIAALVHGSTFALAAGTAHAKDNPLLEAVGSPEGLTLKASLRSRIEAIDGQFRPNIAQDDFMLSLKTTVFAEYDTGPVRFGGELWDARTYFQKTNSSAGTSEVNAMELVQAYVGLDLDDLGDGSRATAKAGRFTLDIGSRRLVARQSFRNTTNAYTGAYLDWNSKAGDRLVLLWSMPQIRLPEDADGIRHDRVEWDQETTDLQLFGGSLTKAGVFGKGTLEIYGYRLFERDSGSRQTRNRRLFTPGIRLSRKPANGAFDYDLEGAYQFGETRSSTATTDLTDLDVSAYFLHAEIGKTFDGPLKPRISVHFDEASGDGPSARTFNRFDNLFGARRFEFGPTSLYGPVGRANLSSPGVRLDVKPDKRLDASLMYRALWLDEATDSFSSTGVRDRNGDTGRFAGHQVEGRVRYWIIPDLLRVDTGAAWLAKGRFLTEAPNAPATGDTHYGYLDLAIEI
ncbi:alginate export family protein [Sphingomonas cavernae]|uniref:Alginate export family protein n=1 Tax=Sphingomonas cavernae TaxID=2320861 RepID=A0A418W7B1_9SPHN|nr:alginate export family protein [Sphingomonas cavernae]RJF85734.1 alginate export family protein [Sphingomonas cavernae]